MDIIIGKYQDIHGNPVKVQKIEIIQDIQYITIKRVEYGVQLVTEGWFEKNCYKAG